MRAPSTRPQFSIAGFLGAASAAPGLSLVVCMLGAAVWAVLAPGALDAFGAALLGVILFFFVVTIWGVVPSMVFGGVVLAVMHTIPWSRRPAALEFMAGGLAAAGLYVLAGLWAAGIAPGVAMLFAPWTTPELIGPGLGGTWWLFASILLAGALAGLFYSVFVKRG